LGGKNLIVFVIWTESSFISGYAIWRSLAVKLNQNKERGGRVAEYSVEKVSDFPVPSRDVTIQILTGGNNLINPGRGEFELGDIPAGDRKIATFFYSVPGEEQDEGNKWRKEECRRRHKKYF
jgi:hypothetical protein